MKAARFYDRGDIRIEDIPEPKVLPGTVGIQVAWCGICGTDLHEFMEGPIFIPPCGHPHPISGESAPVTMGHEFSGVVYAVGEGVDDIQIGQHVVVEPYIIADDVPTGPNDKYHLSKNMNFIGLGGRGGGLSEKIVDISLKYKLLVIIFFMMISIAGIKAYKSIPVDAFPDITPKQVVIYTESPGNSAEDIEKLITYPIESAMSGKSN
jgi:threonine dehydrogenase-like Zn-dependent dehydrogenase